MNRSGSAAGRPSDRRSIPYPDQWSRALVGAMILLGWMFVGWALLSAARA